MQYSTSLSNLSFYASNSQTDDDKALLCEELVRHTMKRKCNIFLDSGDTDLRGLKDLRDNLLKFTPESNHRKIAIECVIEIVLDENAKFNTNVYKRVIRLINALWTSDIPKKDFINPVNLIEILGRVYLPVVPKVDSLTDNIQETTRELFFVYFKDYLKVIEEMIQPLDLEKDDAEINTIISQELSFINSQLRIEVLSRLSKIGKKIRSFKTVSKGSLAKKRFYRCTVTPHLNSIERQLIKCPSILPYLFPENRCEANSSV